MTANARPDGSRPTIAAASDPTDLLSRYDTAALRTLVEAAGEIRRLAHVFAKTGDTPVSELLRDGVREFVELRHYPPGDAYDPDSGCQYYYHCHPRAERAEGEHGHFHIFRVFGHTLAAPGWTDSVVRARQDRDERDTTDPMCHIVAVSMDGRGQPIRLFVPNRWVTGEQWIERNALQAVLEEFDLDVARPSWLLNRWLTALLTLFRPQIERLWDVRKAVIEAAEEHDPATSLPDDRNVEILAETQIDLDLQIRAVEQVFRAAVRKAKSISSPDHRD